MQGEATRGQRGPESRAQPQLGRYRIDQQILHVRYGDGSSGWLRSGAFVVVDRDTDEIIAGALQTFDDAQLVANPLNRQAAGS